MTMRRNRDPGVAEPHAPFTVLHIPHASVAMDALTRRSFCLDDASLDAELLAMTDWFTDELFSLDASLATRVVYPVSRLVLDPERFEDDLLEPMASVGMGAIYTHTSARGALRYAVDEAERERLLTAYYRPHHARLTRAVEIALAEWNACFIVDCHSFGSVPKSYELDPIRALWRLWWKSTAGFT